MARRTEAHCARCPSVIKACRAEEGTGPASCPTLGKQDLLEQVIETYSLPENSLFALNASIQEGEGYGNRSRSEKPYVLNPIKTRVEEIIAFSKKMGYSKIGLAFCTGLAQEAALFTGILEKNGFEVVSVICKVGRVPKETLGVKEEEKIRIGEFESMCNPIAQATLLNEAETEFNVMLGLCVGHDSLFMKYIKGLTTVLAVKDRVTCHNPLAPLYTSKTYYQKLKG